MNPAKKLNPRTHTRILLTRPPYRSSTAVSHSSLRSRALAAAVLLVLAAGSALASEGHEGKPTAAAVPVLGGGQLGVADTPITGPGLPNLEITGIGFLDPDTRDNTISAGQKFMVNTYFKLENPPCTPWSISITVNGYTNTSFPMVENASTAVEEVVGCDGGSANYWWFTGHWVLHKAGDYTVTVELDANSEIAELWENDNSMTVSLEVGGDHTEEWELVSAGRNRVRLSEGTDVIVGCLDEALDFNHPWFDGTDSRGRNRLVAAYQNALGPDGSPINQDHATSLMGIVLARGDNDGDITGLAPDARYVAVELWNEEGHPDITPVDHFDAAGHLVAHDVDVVNMSFAHNHNVNAGLIGEDQINLLIDYLAYQENIVCVGITHQEEDMVTPTAPGTSRNAITVGGLDDDLERVWGRQDSGPLLDGRCKPDLLGNDAKNTVSTSPYWREGFPATEGYYGTSFTAPFVTGAVAQLLGYGKANGENTDHKVIKAVIMNSGVKARDKDGSPWSHSETQPLDDQQGTGVLNIDRVYEMYSAGEQEPGAVSSEGYDEGNVAGTTDTELVGVLSGRKTYQLGTLQSDQARIDATLVWDRHTFWLDDNGSGVIDEGDYFYDSVMDAQDNLDLILYEDGVELTASRSVVDNVEHIHWTDLKQGSSYELVVERLPVEHSGGGEDYAVAWRATGSWRSGKSKHGIFSLAGISTAPGALQMSPNPFSESLTLSFHVAQPGHASVLIYNVAGRLVRRLQASYQALGPQTLSWDGRDANGGQAANGVYFLRFSNGGSSETRRVVFLR